MANKPKSRQQKGGNQGQNPKNRQAGRAEDVGNYDDYVEYEINLEEYTDEDTASFDPVAEKRPQQSPALRREGAPDRSAGSGNETEQQWEYDENWDVEDSSTAPQRTDSVLCEYCGEEYSITYKRCPFCDERQTTGGGRATGGSMDPRHLVGFSISMVLICTAGFIVVKQVLPLLGPQTSSSSTATGDKTNTGSSSGEDSGVEAPTVDLDDWEFPEDGDIGEADVVIDDWTGEDSTSTTEPEVTEPEPALDFNETTETPSGTVTLSTTDVTLKASESFNLSVTSGGSATFSSSHPEYASVNANGLVTNLNTSGDTLLVTITATVNGVKANCVVRCASGAASSSSSSSTSDSSSSSSTSDSSSSSSSTGTSDSSATTSPSIGTGKGTLTAVINIRSGPSTDHDVLGSGYAGSEITVVAPSTDGWYEILFTGSNGVRETGYVMGTYISMG